MFAATLSPARTISSGGSVSYVRPATMVVRQSLSPQQPLHLLIPEVAPRTSSSGRPPTQIRLDWLGSALNCWGVSVSFTTETRMPMGASEADNDRRASSIDCSVLAQRLQVSPLLSVSRTQRITSVFESAGSADWFFGPAQPALQESASTAQHTRYRRVEL